MELELVWVFIIQIFVLGGIAAAILMYLMRNLMCRTRLEIGNKVIFITGCDTGIGYELARHFDALGFRVFAGCLNPGVEGAQRLQIECSPLLRIVDLDVKDKQKVTNAVRYVQENLPAGEDGLWALINNAGVCVCGEYEWMTWDQIENQVQVNLLGVMRVTRSFLQLLKAKKGRIINVSSVAGLRSYPGLSVYCATKFAVEGMSHALRMEMDKFGVNVVTVQPGDFSKATKLLDNHHRNMNEMWDQMTDAYRDEYKEYFVAYHDHVARSGCTGKYRKPATVLPPDVIQGFEEAVIIKHPATSYMVLPGIGTRFKFLLLSLLPSEWLYNITARRYKKNMGRIAHY